MSDTPLLRQHREASRKTQADIARIASEIIGQNITQSQISRWEDDPDGVPGRTLKALAQALGVPLDALWDAPATMDRMRVDPGDPYGQLRKNVELLGACLDAGPTVSVPAGIPSPGQVGDLCTRLRRKPTVVLAGHFDAGKSRLCNALIGSDSLPARYTPTTAANTWLVHLQDRPSWCDQSVYVFGPGFQPDKVDDQGYAESHVVAAGDVDLLVAYATHKEGRETNAEYTVYVFLDRPILRACTLIDLPGHQHNERDARLAETALARADVLIYLSTATGFLDGEDLAHLRRHLRTLPLLETHGLAPFGNLLIVASQAHPNISDEDLAQILDKGAATLERELRNTVFAERQERSKLTIPDGLIRGRIFPFWFERDDRSQALRAAIGTMLGRDVPAALLSAADEEVEGFRAMARGACDNQIAQYRAVLHDLEAARRDLEARTAAEPTRHQERDLLQSQVRQAIAEAEVLSLRRLEEIFDEQVSPEHVELIIHRRYGNDKKAAQEHALGAVVDIVQSTIAAEVDRRAQGVARMVEKYLGRYADDAAVLTRPDGRHAVPIAFDARGAFLGGMAGLTTLGALGVWAASLGNLGGYIIVAKVASLLATLGIEIGGSAALVSFVAAMGGPVTWAIGIALAVGGLIAAVFGDSWQRRLSRKVVEAIAQKKVHGQFAHGIHSYWHDTLHSFNHASAFVEHEYQKQLTQLRDVIARGATDRAQLDELLQTIGKIRDFFAGLPWKTVG